jgi:CelD/BcsL family acetyltransferase involved in cellulose biosynthesis
MTAEAAMPAITHAPSAAPAARVRVARTAEEVESLRDAWATLEWGDLEADLDFFGEVADLRDAIIRPHVIVIERDGQTRAMAMARLETRELAARVGGHTIVRRRLRCLTVVHGGTASRDDASEAALVAELWRAVRSGEADAVFLHKVRVGSTLERAAHERWPRVLRPASPPPSGHWRLNLPESFDTYLARLSSRTRASVRKQARVLEGQFGERLEVRRYGGPGDADALGAELEAIAARSYQRGLGAGFRADAEGRALLELSLRQGWTQAWVLHLEGRPCAYQFGHRFGDTFFGAATGFDPEYTRLRPGTYIQMRAVEDLCADPDIVAIDYGYGDADYKRSLADERWEDVDLTLLGPRPRALVAGGALAAAAIADRAARRALGDGQLMARLRRHRRERALAAQR